MKLVALSKAEQNQSVLDPWTVVHFGFGLAAGLSGFNFAVSMLGAVAYEVFEQAFERSGRGQRFFKTSGPEITANAVVDVLIFGAGYYLGQKWNE